MLDRSIQMVQTLLMWQLPCVLGAAYVIFLAMEHNPRQRKRAALMGAIQKKDDLDGDQAYR